MFSFQGVTFSKSNINVQNFVLDVQIFLFSILTDVYAGALDELAPIVRVSYEGCF